MENGNKGFYHTITININDKKFNRLRKENVVKFLESGKSGFMQFDGKEWKFIKLPKK